MSDHSVKVYKIAIKDCPNSDNLLIANPIGTDWSCLVRKDEGWKDGDLGAYIPIDTKMEPHPDFKFLEQRHWRIRTIKLRGQISQGLVVKAKPGWKLGKDVTKELGVSRYEKPEEGQLHTYHKKTFWTQLVKRVKRFLGLSMSEPEWFTDHTDIENIKNHPFVFNEGEEVIVTEKVEGTNFRSAFDDSGWNLPTTFGGLDPSKIRWYHKMIARLLNPKFLVGSHFMNKPLNSTVIYVQMAKLLGLEAIYRKIFKGHRVVVFGEIFGIGVPNGCKRMNYNIKPSVALFDIKLDGKWQDWDQVEAFAKQIGIPAAPVLYRGPFTLEKIRELSQGPTVIGKGCHIREGVVVRSARNEEYHNLPGHRKWLKAINPEYLLLKNKQEDEEEKNGNVQTSS